MVKVWVLFTRDLTKPIEALPEAEFPINYTPYCVGNIGQRFSISRQRYEFKLAKGKDNTSPTNLMRDIVIRFTKRDTEKQKFADSKKLPFLFVTITGYKQNDAQAINKAWEGIKIKSSAIMHYRGLERQSV